MLDFFTYKNGIPFKIYGGTHMLLLLITLLGVISIYVFRDKLRKFNHQKQVRYLMAAILFVNMMVYYVTLALNGLWSWKTDLPFHLCFITGFTFMYVLVTDNKKLYKIVYFFTFVGPMPAMLLLDITQSFNRFIFWQFFISHHFMLMCSVYCLVVLQYKIQLKDIVPAYIVGNILVAGMTVFNTIAGTNYIMVYELPSVVYKVLPFVKYGPPIFWLELAALGGISAAYIMVAIKDKVDKKQVMEEVLA